MRFGVARKFIIFSYTKKLHGCNFFVVSRETNLRLLKYEISQQTRKQFQSQDTRFSMKQNWAVPQCTKYTRNGAIAEPVVADSTERLVQNKKYI